MSNAQLHMNDEAHSLIALIQADALFLRGMLMHLIARETGKDDMLLAEIAGMLDVMYARLAGKFEERGLADHTHTLDELRRDIALDLAHALGEESKRRQGARGIGR